MAVKRGDVVQALEGLALPGGGTLASSDMLRALTIESGVVRFVIEAPDPEQARALEGVRRAAEELVAGLPGVTQAQVLLTAHAPDTEGKPAPQGPARLPGVERIVAIASGKGGVGKSTVSANLAVALAAQGRRVGLLDADMYGPSQPRMMGVSQQPSSPDGKVILPLQAHGVTMMSIGLILKERDEAVVWRGAMLTGALEQLLTQVRWGALDVLIVDMPPGTGDIQLTLSQKFALDAAVIVSTPQDVALLDARKALRAFETMNVPVAGLIENMSTYICPKCGHEEHIFGEGGVRAEAERLGLPFLGELPLSLEVRRSGDAGTPIAATDSPVATAYSRLASDLVAAGLG